MQKHSEDFYKAAIKSAFPNSWSIRHPNICGGVSPIFLVNTPSCVQVCKFNEYALSFRNRVVSQLLELADVPVPRISVHAYLNTWFETYPYCHDKTLYEHVQYGATDTQIFNAFKQAIEIQKKITEIRPDKFQPKFCRYASDVFTMTQKMRLPHALANAYGMVHKLFSQRGEMRLMHNDLQVQNILVDEKMNATRLIDLDSVALCNESFSVLTMLRVYPLNNHNEIMDFYEDTMQRKLNRHAIITGLQILQSIRAPQLKLNQMLWRGYNPPPQR